MRYPLVIAGGYTAGHITPGLALAEALAPECACLFMGSSDGMEADLVKRAGLPFFGVAARPWSRRGPLTRAASLAVLAPAVWQARRELRRVQARALVSLGSFAALAPALAAVSLRLPVLLHETNTSLGLAHRVLRPWAKALLTSRLFDEAPRRGPRATVVGTPLRAGFRALAARAVDCEPGAARVLVLGGSLGNPFFNQRLPGAMRCLRARLPALSVTHQCGHAVDPAPIGRAYAEAGVAAEVRPYLDPMPPAFESVQLVIATAGAVTLHELAAAGIPALIMPLEGAAARHQHANASAFTELTGCPHVSEETWDEIRVADTLSELLADPVGWRSCSRRLRALHNPDAGQSIAAVLRPHLALSS